MKKYDFLWMGILLMVMCFGMTACTEEGGNDDELDITLTTPAFATISALYEVEMGNTDIKSVELTESGQYIIIKDGPKVYEVSRKGLLRVAPQVRAIEQENMISGEYSKVSNVEYALEGYGTLKVNVFADDGKFATITLFPINGGSVAMDVVAKEPVSTSDMTQLLCRTWYPETCEMKEWENDRLVWHGMLDFAKKEVIKYVTLDGEHFEGDEWLQKVIFSKSGTYTCYYEDDFDMASWYWVDETTGQFGYYWGEGDSETGDLPSGGVDMPTVDTPTLEESVEKKNIYDERDVVYVSFYGNKMKVTEESYYYAYLGIAYKSTSITTLRAAE